MSKQREQLIQDVFDGLGRFKRSMHAHFQGGFADLKLSPTQLDILRILQQEQPMSHKALAARLQLTPGAVSQLLDGLDREHCIAREQNPSDRRISYVSLSRGGKHKLEDMRAHHKKLFTHAFEALNDDELQAYLHAQQKLITWLEANQPANTK